MKKTNLEKVSPKTLNEEPRRYLPGSKLKNAEIEAIVKGFVCGQPLPQIADQAGVSTKTCRNLILRIRALLLRPEFSRWMIVVQYLAIYEHDQSAVDVYERGFYIPNATCYANRRCQSNYKQGKRADRLCRSCPLFDMIPSEGPWYEEGLEEIRGYVAFHDQIRSIYDYLGLGKDRNLSDVDEFRLRLHHVLIVQYADSKTRQLPDDTPDFGHKSYLTVRSLYDQILKSLADAA